MFDLLDAHYRMVIKAIIDGRLIPFLGAGFNLCGRPPGTSWLRGQYLPSGGELAAYLAENFGYPSEDALDLVRVSQYVAVVTGSGPLYEELRNLFDADYPPTAFTSSWRRSPPPCVKKAIPRAIN
jgi:hypothetical protein